MWLKKYMAVQALLGITLRGACLPRKPTQNQTRLQLKQPCQTLHHIVKQLSGFLEIHFHRLH